MVKAICGIYNYGQDKVSLSQKISSMLNAFSCQGKNTYVSAGNRIALASVFDENRDGNSLSLSDTCKRPRVIAKGNIFKKNILPDHSGIEAITSLFEENDVTCFNSIEGEFAAAVWDGNKNKLILARDRFGTKSIYYASIDNKIIFASEIKAILAYPGFRTNLNEKTLFYYASLGYSPAPLTMFEGIHKVLPGNFIEFDSQGVGRQEQYWDIAYSEAEKGISDEQAVLKIRHLLSEAVKSRVLSDKPIGCLLSGGKDSTAILALMSKFLSPGDINSFTIAFKPSDNSSILLPQDLISAREIARIFKTRHNEIIVTSKDMMDALPSITSQIEDLFSLPCIFFGYLVSRFAKEKGVSAILSGDGEEEIFFGYDWILKFYNIAMSLPVSSLRKLPRPITAMIYSLTDAILSHSFLKDKYLTASILECMKRISRGQEIYWGNATPFSEMSRANLLSEDFLKRHVDLHPFNAVENILAGLKKKKPDCSLFERMVYLDIKGWLGERYLKRIEMGSTANGIEERLPYLDSSLVEFVMAVPERLRFRRQTSYLFNKSIQGLIPDWVLKREKMIFPQSMLSTNTEFIALAKDTILSSNILKKGYFNQDTINRIFANHARGHSDNAHTIFNLYFLCAWFDKWIN